MGVRGFVRVAGCAAFAIGVGSSAEAIESLTGTYTGKISCRVNLGGVTSKEKREITVEIIDQAPGVRLDIDAGADPVLAELRGFIVANTVKADRASITGIECGLDAASLSGAALRADLVIKPGSEKGTIKGTIIDMSVTSGGEAICTFVAKRTSILEPSVDVCVI